MANKIIKIKQRDFSDCGAACLASISSYYGYRLPLSRIRQYASTDRKGTNILGMVEAAKKLGFTSKGVRAHFEDLKSIPKPVIAHLLIKEKLYHYVVIFEITKDFIIVMDPMDGEVHKKPYEDFKKEWTGVLIILSPSEAFEQADKTTSALKRFWLLIAPHKTVMIEALIGSIITTILGLSTAVYVQKIVDNVLVEGNKNLLNLMSMLMIAILIISLFISSMRGLIVLRTGQKIDVRLILGYYKHLMQLPQSFFDNMRIGEIISRMNDAVKIRSFINDASLNLVLSIFITIFSFSMIFIYSWKIALIMLVVIPLYSIVYYIVNKMNKQYQRQLMENSADLESHLVESLNSIPTIKRFGLEWFTNIKMETRFVKLLNTSYKSVVNSIFASNSSTFISGLFTITLLWVGAGFVLEQTLTPGELMSCYALIGYFTGPISSLININRTIQDALIASDRLFEIMDLEREQAEGTMNLTEDNTGDILFDNVSFRYGYRKDVFKGLSLTIKKGSITGIIGESGSGKTTLISLLQKIYPLQEGRIKIGEYDLTYVTNESLRKIVGVVPQKVDLFIGTIIENIAIGDFEPDMERIISICNELGITGFIEKQPNGFQTFLGESGTSLSEGEKQRIAIVRALYKKPDILILDEATSALDSASESYVQKAVKSFCKDGKTVIIIAHRLTTIMNADKIIVLKDGEKVEEGKHKKLLSKKGEYHRLWKFQHPMYKN